MRKGFSNYKTRGKCKSTFVFCFKKRGESGFCASVLLKEMCRLLDLKLLKFSVFLILLNINYRSYAFRTIANHISVIDFDCSRYFEKYSDSKCKQSVCFYYVL